MKASEIPGARTARPRLLYPLGALALLGCAPSPGASSGRDAAADSAGADAAAPTGSDAAPPTGSDAAPAAPETPPREAGAPGARPGGCGLAQPAFCDEFEAAAPAVHGRAGELDPR